MSLGGRRRLRDRQLPVLRLTHDLDVRHEVEERAQPAPDHAVVVDERACVLETLTGIKRAGADAILTYFALDAAKWLKR